MTVGVVAIAAVTLALSLLVWGLTSRGDSTQSREGRAPGLSVTVPPAASSAHAASAPKSGPSTVKPRGTPQRVVVTSASGTTLVDASLVPSTLDEEGVLAPPFGVAGWYAEKGWAKPGWPGASILAGHINRRSPTVVPDTFAQLTKVRPGDRISVDYSSGQSVAFVATKSQALSKTAVPKDDSIWDAANPEPLLRLITCDPETPVHGGHYKGNWVVWASLA